jgi:hypothetical protein
VDAAVAVPDLLLELTLSYLVSLRENLGQRLFSNATTARPRAAACGAL